MIVENSDLWKRWTIYDRDRRPRSAIYDLWKRWVQRFKSMGPYLCFKHTMLLLQMILGCCKWVCITFFLRSISRSTGTGDFEFFTFFTISPLYWRLWVFHVFRLFPSTGNFEFFAFFSTFPPVLETLSFSSCPEDELTKINKDTIDILQHHNILMIFNT